MTWFRPLLWTILAKLGIHDEMLRALQSQYFEAQYAMKVGNRIGQSRISLTGLKQGCSLSTTLLGNFVDGISLMHRWHFATHLDSLSARLRRILLVTPRQSPRSPGSVGVSSCCGWVVSFLRVIRFSKQIHKISQSEESSLSQLWGLKHWLAIYSYWEYGVLSGHVVWHTIFQTWQSLLIWMLKWKICIVGCTGWHCTIYHGRHWCSVISVYLCRDYKEEEVEWAVVLKFQSRSNLDMEKLKLTYIDSARQVLAIWISKCWFSKLQSCLCKYQSSRLRAKRNRMTDSKMASHEK